MTLEEFYKALYEAGFVLHDAMTSTFKRDGVIVRKERDSIVTKFRVYRRTARGGYQKLSHVNTLDCALACAITCEPKEVIRLNKIKPIPFKGNTTIHVARYEEFNMYCIRHLVSRVIVKPAVLDQDTGIALTDTTELAKPDRKIWWIARCVSQNGAKFDIITDEEIFYPITCRINKSQEHWKIRHININLNEMTKTDIFLISYAIMAYKKEIAGEHNE